MLLHVNAVTVTRLSLLFSYTKQHPLMSLCLCLHEGQREAECQESTGGQVRSVRRPTKNTRTPIHHHPGYTRRPKRRPNSTNARTNTTLVNSPSRLWGLTRHTRCHGRRKRLNRVYISQRKHPPLDHRSVSCNAWLKESCVQMLSYFHNKMSRCFEFFVFFCYFSIDQFKLQLVLYAFFVRCLHQLCVGYLTGRINKDKGQGGT